jgi:hypothetical protein
MYTSCAAAIEENADIKQAAIRYLRARMMLDPNFIPQPAFPWSTSLIGSRGAVPQENN